MALQFKDYYQTLEVPRTASAADIKKAFRKQARIHHPDVAKDKSSAEEKFKDINEAYEVLSDPEKRKRFDELGANWQQTQTNHPARGNGYEQWTGQPDAGTSFEFDGTGFSDFFETYFAGRRDGFGGSHHGRTNRPDEPIRRRGHDVEADLLVTLDEALHGAQRVVTLRRPGDSGTAERTDTYNVRIPVGVHEGQKIRLSGQGSPGSGGGTAGDLYLLVRLARHPEFTVQGSDLYYELDLAPWEAVLGAQIQIPALDGATTLKVPPGTKGGSKLRLRGLGLPQANGVRGDLFATVNIVTPTTVSAEEQAIWEELSTKSNFKPRNPS